MIINFAAQDAICGFCGRSGDARTPMLGSSSARICASCIGLCNDIIATELEREDAAASAMNPVQKELAPLRAIVPLLLTNGLPRPLADELISAIDDAEG